MWAEKYVGSAWELGGDGSNIGYDCWGLLCAVQKNEFKRHIPIIDYKGVTYDKIKLDFVKKWEIVKNGGIIDGDCLLLRYGALNNAHVGIAAIISGKTYVLHAQEGFGVVLERLGAVAAKGWDVRKVYRYRS